VNYAFDEISNPALRKQRSQPAGLEPVAVRPLTSAALLEVRDLSVAYASDAGSVVAVDHVSFDVARGEFLGIVGESGCGKSTLLYAIARLLYPPLGGSIIGGEIIFHGRDMVRLTEDQLRHIRWCDFSAVLQSTMNALNPVLTIPDQLESTCKTPSRK